VKPEQLTFLIVISAPMLVPFDVEQPRVGIGCVSRGRSSTPPL